MCSLHFIVAVGLFVYIPDIKKKTQKRKKKHYKL